MPFPKSERVIYKKNPLTEVICQLRFPTILEISSEQPATFQKRIRSSYPLYEKKDAGLPKDFTDAFSGLPLPKLKEGTEHKFLTEQRDRSIVLTQDFVAVTSHDYSQWGSFLEKLKLAMDALEDIYEPAFYSRIGLRYINTIDRHNLGIDHEPWDKLLKPHLIGALGAPELQDRLEDIRTVASIKLDDAPGGIARLRHGLTRPSPEAEQEYHIDVDFFTEERSASKNVYEILGKFNRHAGNLFRWIITPKLHDALEPRELEPTA